MSCSCEGQNQSPIRSRRERHLIALAAGIATFVTWLGTVRAGLIDLPNRSFESPVTVFVLPYIDSWQETPKPDDYVEDDTYTWDQLTEVLMYPDDFDRDYRFGRPDLSGQAHPWGIVILSAPALLRSFARTEDGYHLGVHEFAHLLDLAQTRFDGIPPYLSDGSIRKWVTIMAQEEERLRRGNSELSPYGLTGPEELFAVAVEAFFQTPVALTRSHSELYAFLAAYFGQDPAEWSGDVQPHQE